MSRSRSRLGVGRTEILGLEKNEEGFVRRHAVQLPRPQPQDNYSNLRWSGCVALH